MLQVLLSAFVVLAVSAACSCTEAALFSAPALKVRQHAQLGRPAALALLKIRRNMARPIATIVVLNNIANIVGSIVVATVAARMLGDRWLGLVSGVLTLAIIVAGEIVPKTLGERYAEPVALAMARPVALLTVLFAPLTWVVLQLTAPFTRGRSTFTTNEDEIRLLTEIGGEEGIIEERESEMIRRVFTLNDVPAWELMTPRVALTYLDDDLMLDEAQAEIIASPHSRIVVTGEGVDDVIGIALKSELLAALVEGQGSRPVRDFVREVDFLPESVHADKLLRYFQDSHRHLAVVVDEYGGVEGVVTLEDVLEMLTGEIVDETDRTADMRAAARQRALRGGLSNGVSSAGDIEKDASGI